MRELDLCETKENYPSHSKFSGDKNRAHHIWLADLRVFHWQWFVFDRRFCSGNTNNFVGKLFNGHLARIAQVDRLVEIAHGQFENSVDQIRHVTKRARLRAIAKNG